MATSTVGIAVGLTFIGLFASIYHPVGTAMLVQGRQKIGRLIGVNGVFGNMGMAAALVAGGLSDLSGWRAAFIVPGLVALATGLVFVALAPRMAPPAAAAAGGGLGGKRFFLAGLICLAFMTTFAGMIFYATSIAMPKLFEERLDLWGDTRSGIGGLVAVIYVIAAMTQIVVGIMVDRYPIKLLLIAVIGLQVPLLLLVASAEGYWLPLAALMLPARQARPAAA